MVEQAEAVISTSIKPHPGTYHVDDSLDGDRFRLVQCQFPQRSQQELISYKAKAGHNKKCCQMDGGRQAQKDLSSKG